MPSSVSSPQPSSQRALAAILFTDVVGFSALMQKSEERTAQLLERDFGEMRRLCALHEGTVLKTTGDGLLCTFSSAVKAVACAVAMQRHLSHVAHESAADAALQHRIGIHLGDVLVQEQDVIGDGVNIASRLQAEAAPGGICISQTVYDVVKNKLAIQTTFIGARELKNISEAVPAYRVLIEAEEDSGKGGISAAAAHAAAMGGRSAARSFRRFASAAGIAAAAIGAFLYYRHREQPATVPPSGSPSAAVAANTSTNPVPAAATAGEKRSVSAAPTGSGIGAENPSSEIVREIDAMPTDRKQFMAEARERFLRHYEFAAYGEALRHEAQVTGRPESKLLERAMPLLQNLRNWVTQQLARYDETRPLRIAAISANEHPVHLAVFGFSHEQLGVIEQSSVVHRPVSELPPAQFGGVILALLGHDRHPGPRVVAGAEVFAKLYHLVPMQRRLASLFHNERKPGEDEYPAARPQRWQPRNTKRSSAAASDSYVN